MLEELSVHTSDELDDATALLDSITELLGTAPYCLARHGHARVRHAHEIRFLRGNVQVPGIVFACRIFTADIGRLVREVDVVLHHMSLAALEHDAVGAC